MGGVNSGQIRPIYSQLQGILSQTPKDKDSLSDKYWVLFHETIDELNQVTGKDYQKFKVKLIVDDGFGGDFIRCADFRQRVGGLISRLHGEFFSTEPPPFSGMPGVVVHQTQNQSQTMQNVILDFAVQLGQKIEENKDNPKKVSFLNGLKNGLTSVKDIGDLIKGIASHAKEFGLGVEDIQNIFS